MFRIFIPLILLVLGWVLCFMDGISLDTAIILNAIIVLLYPLYLDYQEEEWEMKVKLIKFPKKPIPSAKKIATRGLYEIISPKSKKRDYGKRIKKGKY